MKFWESNAVYKYTLSIVFLQTHLKNHLYTFSVVVEKSLALGLYTIGFRLMGNIFLSVHNIFSIQYDHRLSGDCLIYGTIHSIGEKVKDFKI